MSLVLSTPVSIRKPRKHEAVYHHDYHPVKKFLFGRKHPLLIRKVLDRIALPDEPIHVSPTNFHADARDITGFSEIICNQFRQYDQRYVFTVFNRKTMRAPQAYVLGLTRILDGQPDPTSDRYRNYSVHLMEIDPKHIIKREYAGPSMVSSMVRVGEHLGRWEYIPMAFSIDYIEARKPRNRPWGLILYGSDSSMWIELTHRSRARAWSECMHVPESTHGIYPGGFGRRTICYKCGLGIEVDTSG